MKKINTMGKTITGLTESEFIMVIRTLKNRSLEFEIKASNYKDSKDDFEFYHKMSKQYNELAKFIESQQ